MQTLATGATTPAVAAPSLDTDVDDLVRDSVSGALTDERFAAAEELLHRVGGPLPLDARTAADLVSGLREQGHLDRALRLATRARDLSPTLARARDFLAGEVKVLTSAVTGRQSPDPVVPVSDTRVLHLVSTSLPHVESSYTRRTAQLCRAQTAVTFEPHVVTHAGFHGPESGWTTQAVDGVPHHRIGGPARGTLPLDAWLDDHVDTVTALAREVRPAVLHAASDFVNGLTAVRVGAALSLPVVYEVRGEWHESWYERTAERFGWPALAEGGPAGGPPVAYLWRKELEVRVALAADHVLAATPALAAALREAGVVGVTVAEEAGDPVALFEAYAAAESALRGRLAGEAAPSAWHLLGVGGPTAAPERALWSAKSGDPDVIMTSGWTIAGGPRLFLHEGMEWRRLEPDHRSHAFYLHAWEFMGPVLERYARTSDRRYLDWAVGIAVSWCRAYAVGDPAGADAAVPTMAWYDMALALRAPRLAYIVAEAARHPMADDAREVLAAGVRRHEARFLRDDSFVAHNNHGFYTAIGQLRFASRLSGAPRMAAVERVGRARLRLVAGTQFAEDGGHLEHSPDYHRMLLGSFEEAIEDGLVTDPVVLERVRLAGEVLRWFQRPDGALPLIGDTPHRVLRQADTGPQTLKVLDHSGYVIVRTPPGAGAHGAGPGGCHLVLMAGFHSRTHKHADDLSLTWFDGGEDLLTDAGRFGYGDLLPADAPERLQGFFYGSPERQYVEGTRAHNTVEADGRDHERRGRRPYGSAVTSAEERDGHYRISGEVDHGHWRHTRTLVLRPGHWLSVRDDVTSLDGAPHDFRAWWLLPGELAGPRPAGDALGFSLTGGASLWWCPLSDDETVAPARGQRDPLRGWRSLREGELVPAWSLARLAAGRREHSFRTVFVLGEEPVTGEPPHPFTAG